ncbi:unnamed protein product [Closterium sp. Yama58-4]|nr:unnamed protein product [Closterium sp. Yama58-4]
MYVYKDLISGDPLLSSHYRTKEIQNGESQWVEKGGEDEAVEGEPEKVVDIVNSFKLQELPVFDKRALGDYLKTYTRKLAELIPHERQREFRAGSSGAAQWLISKIDDLNFFAGESMNVDDLDGSVVYAYHKDGAANLTFIYFKDGLKKDDYF